MAKPEFKILVVDDEPLISFSIEAAIVEAGFDVIFAQSAAEARGIVEARSHELVAIISDLRMPGQDGLELRASLLKRFRDIPFIILSGFVTRELALRGVDLKIAAFLDKPVGDEVVKTVLTRETETRLSQLKERQAIEKTFFSEAHSIIEELEPLILSLEDNPGDSDTINVIFRLVHTLKGSSGILDTDVFYKFVHRFEDMLTRIKSSEIAVSSLAISAMLRGYDIVKTMIASIESRDGTVFVLETLIEQIKIDGRRPTDAAGPQKKPDQGSKKSAPTEAKGDTIRVTTKTLDEFMELSGEITVIRNMVNKLVRSIEKTQPGNKDINLLAELLEEMHKINGSLQGRIVDLRKVAVATSIRPLKRTVRDLSTSLGKGLELITSGEELRIDTAISQVLSDSLIHLVRNSADHGIESPEQRLAAGKPAGGRIKISCTEEHDEVVVTIGDDGRGIDTEKVKKKLIDSGMMTLDDVNALPRPQLLAKILEPGFSTAATVSEVSGRGVGTDMVKTSVERMRGRIDITTDKGVGTTFTLRLPIPKSVLIVNSLLVTTGDQVFAIPQDSVVRLLQYSRSQAATQMRDLQGGTVLKMGESHIPLVDLATILKLHRTSAVKTPDDDVSIVVVKGASTSFGLIVDAILDGEEVVVKPIGKHLESLQCFSGATFLGDGHVGLIIDVNGIEKYARIAGAAADDRRENTRGSTATTPTRTEYLLFRLNHPGIYGVPLRQIYRLEEIAVAKLRFSGEQRVALYRDAILPIFGLDGLLGFNATAAVDNETLVILVFEHEKRLFGLNAKAIVDIVSSETEVDATICDRVGIVGNMFVGDEPICIVDFRILLASRGHIAVHEEKIAPLPANVVPIKIVASETEADAGVIVPVGDAAIAAGWGLFE